MLKLRITLLLGLEHRFRAGEQLIEDRWLDPIDLDALRIMNRHRGAEFLAQTLKHRHRILGMTGEAPRSHDVRFGVCERSDNSNGGNRFLQRKRSEEHTSELQSRENL